MFTRRQNQRAFTLVETMVAMTLLALVIVPIFALFALSDYAAREQKINGRLMGVVEYHQNYLQVAPYDRILSLLTVDGTVLEKVMVDSGPLFTSNQIGYAVMYRILAYDNVGTPEEAITIDAVVTRNVIEEAPNHSQRNAGRAPSGAVTTPLHVTVTRRKF